MISTGILLKSYTHHQLNGFRDVFRLLIYDCQYGGKCVHGHVYKQQCLYQVHSSCNTRYAWIMERIFILRLSIFHHLHFLSCHFLSVHQFLLLPFLDRPSICLPFLVIFLTCRENDKRNWSRWCTAMWLLRFFACPVSTIERVLLLLTKNLLV